MMITRHVFVSVSGYPPLQPASFKPQPVRHRGTVAGTPRGLTAVLQRERTLYKGVTNGSG